MKKKNILIADSGSTKTDWLLLSDGSEKRLQTAGINPVVQPQEVIDETLRQLLTQIDEAEVSELHFYGAGVMGDYRELMIHRLRELFPQTETIEAESDLLGAARAVCGREEGIACILGTGSNSCHYDGQTIVSNIPPLGYILGDEGSGATLGKLFLNALLKGDLPQSMLEDFYETTRLTYQDIIRRVYREPLANRFLASTSLYIHAHAHKEGIRELIVQNFQAFFSKNVLKYGRRDLPVSAVGSIAQAYEPYFREVAQDCGLQIGRIMKSPIDGLRIYHG